VRTKNAQSRAAAQRHQFSSVTIHQIAAAVSDQGQVYAAQFPPMLRENGMWVADGFQNEVGDSFVGRSFTTVLPSNESQMSAMAPGYYMGESREGVYLPLKLAGPTQPFGCAQWCGPTENGAAQWYASTPTNTIQPGAMLQVAPFTNGLDVPWPYRYMYSSSVSAGFTTPTVLAMDTGFDNTCIGVAIFRGLSGSNTGFGTSLQLKTCNGLELVATPEAADRVYAEHPAPYEPRALEAYYALCLELPDAFPASFNSLGSILDAIRSVASRVWNVVEKPITAVAGAAIPAAAAMLAQRYGVPIATGKAALKGAGGSLAARGRKVQGVRRSPSSASAAPRNRLMGAGGRGVRKTARVSYKSTR